MTSKNLGKIAIGATGAALAAAAAAAVGTLLANKELRDNLGRKANETLKSVSKLAGDFEKNSLTGKNGLRGKGGVKRVKKTSKKKR